MASPALFVENFFSTVQFSGHTVVANEEPAGTEAFRVADGRRSSRDFWSPTTLNASANIRVTCDRVRAANMMALDRGHNLAGKQIKLECSDDDFTTTQTVLDITLPSATAPGSVDDALGVRTEEGAWVKRFPTRAATYWRLTIPAMGAGLKPQVVGLWVGLSYAPSHLRLPVAENLATLVVEEIQSDAGWMGAGTGTLRREGVLRFKFPDLFEYEVARYHVEGHFSARRPMWIIHDDNQSDRAVLAIRGSGALGYQQRTQEWFPPSGEINWLEHEPTRAT